MAPKNEPKQKKSPCQIFVSNKGRRTLEALRTPTDVWEAGGHIWEVVRTQGGHPSSPGSPEKRQRERNTVQDQQQGQAPAQSGPHRLPEVRYSSLVKQCFVGSAEEAGLGPRGRERHSEIGQERLRVNKGWSTLHTGFRRELNVPEGQAVLGIAWEANCLHHLFPTFGRFSM